MFCEVLELEIRQEQVSRFCKFAQHVFAIRFVQICVVGVETRDLEEFEAAQNIVFLELELGLDFVDFAMVKPAEFE